MEEQLSELRKLAAHAQNRRTETGIPRVAMVRGAVPEHELAAVYEPMVNLILQGCKSMTVGGQTLHYDPATYFVMSVDLPAAGIVRSSDLAVLMPHNFAQGFAEAGALALIEPDLPLRDFTVSMHWSARFDKDPCLQWLRANVSRLFGTPTNTTEVNS